MAIVCLIANEKGRFIKNAAECGYPPSMKDFSEDITLGYSFGFVGTGIDVWR